MTTRTQTVLQLGGWAAYPNGVVSAIGLVFLNLPHGLRIGLLVVTYVGYPIWAFWLGRHLLQLVREPVSGSVLERG